MIGFTFQSESRKQRYKDETGHKYDENELDADDIELDDDYKLGNFEDDIVTNVGSSV